MTRRFDFKSTELLGLKLVKRHPIGDSRGLLERTYCVSEFEEAGLDKVIRQINRTVTREKGTIRGLHFQKPPAMEAKVVSCLQGCVFDVAVDLRDGSTTFGKWFGIELSRDNGLSLLIPEGFAHGFQTLEENCEMLYLHTADYTPAAEGGINALDPEIGIAWPLAVSVMSERDKGLPALDRHLEGLPA